MGVLTIRALLFLGPFYGHGFSDQNKETEQKGQLTSAVQMESFAALEPRLLQASSSPAADKTSARLANGERISPSICIHVYICLYICVHTYLYVFVPFYLHVIYLCVFVLLYIYYIHVYVYVYTLTHMNTNIYGHICICVYIHSYSY